MNNVYVKKKMSFWQKLYRYRFLYILVLPALLCTLVFSYLPMPGIIIAFQDFDIFKGFAGSEFVGLENFKFIFSSSAFLGAIKNTLIYSSVLLILGFVMPIGLALMFNEIKNLKFKKVVQTISYMPYFLSWASVIALVYAFFGNYGTYNDAMAKLVGEGYERVNLLMNSDNFLGFVAGTHMWKNLGWSSVIYMAAIAGIDPSLYEAAEIDGANRLQKAMHITLPGIAVTAVVILIMSVGSLINSNFEQVYGLQNIFTQESTETINTLVYRQGLCNGNYSMSTAFGLFQGIISFILVTTVNKVSKKTANMSVW